MKTFLNVLYRKILYRIPLKFLLLLLAIFGLLFASFSSADYLNGLTYVKQINLNNSSINSSNVNSYMGISDNESYLCFNIIEHTSNNSISIRIGNIQSYITPMGGLGFTCLGAWNGGSFILNENGGNTTAKIDVYKMPRDGFTLISVTSGNPGYTSLECQTEYNLIPISSVDQNYCTTNNLCPSCPSCPDIPVYSGTVSNVYINDILHVGAPNIVMNIAEEIDWDYEYTAGGNNMNIDVVGYNVDYEKIGEIIDNQNYKPSSEDFKNILGILAPYTKIIVFFVFLFLVWAWIKKPFKSKKL